VHSHQQPSFFLGEYSTFLKFEKNAWYFYSDDLEADSIYQYISDLIDQPLKAEQDRLLLIEEFSPRWSKQEYLNSFNQVQEYIKAGDCYQINLTQEFSARSQGSVLSRAQDLWELTHAPYAGYLKINDFELLSCSPELFIEFQMIEK
jgi:para-aminobenzoate synthetase component 1